MNRSYLSLSFILVILFLPHQSKSTEDSCIEERATLGVVQMSRTLSSSGQSCWVNAHNNLAYKDLIYRDFMFGSDGLFLVFNSFGAGPDSRDTGAREYYTFPRRMTPKFVVDLEKNQIKIILASGEDLTFEAKTMRVLSMSHAVFFEDPKVNPHNQGGFEIQAHAKLFLDCGFKIGESPSSDPKNKCRFRDPKGQSCIVRSQELFIYDSDGDRFFRWNDDVGLAQYLSQRCEHLDISSLTSVF